MKKIEADRPQVNVRLTDELVRLLDAKRVELLPELGTIPTRSDVVRIAIERFLKVAPKTKAGSK
jgi:Arc/MetJ-type ribon-helix-helix transcriptional regulator